jgi:hypothetical protein
MRPFVKGFRSARAVYGAVAVFCLLFVGLTLWSAFDPHSPTDIVHRRWPEVTFSLMPAIAGIFAVRRSLFWHKKVQAAERQSRDLPKI